MEADHDQENQFPVIGLSNKQVCSGEEKPWIKLKIQKIEEQEDQIRPRKNDEPRVCKVCKKGFSSGKALGGHMRIHVQNNKELKTNQNQYNIGDSDKDNSGCYSKPVCSICSKNFPSMKSLFGHMRCHPEREWRGIQPPPRPPAAKDSSSYSSYVSDSEQLKADNQTYIDSDMGIQEIDLTKSLVGWSATAKRGRRALIAATGTMAEEKRLRDAVDDLMRLAHSGDSLDLESGSGLTHKHRVVVEATNSNSLTNKVETEGKNRVFESKKRKRIIDESEPPVDFKMDHHPGSTDMSHHVSVSRGSNSVLVKNLEKGKGKAVLETEPNFTDSDESIPSEQLIVNYKYKNNNKSAMIKKKKRMMVKLSDLGLVQIDQFHRPIDRYYKCSTCNKCFPTHQALGGHRSSHNKAKTSQTTIDESSYAAAEDITRADETKENEGAGSSKPADSALHRCKICNKDFATGQALGGHKRCHWTGPVEAPSSQATSSPPGEASQTGQKILGFDLNELPAMEDEDGVEDSEEHGSGYGFASSSYNNSVS